MVDAITLASKRIVRNPRILDGEPTIKGTRVPVRSVVIISQLYHERARVREAFPMLDDADIDVALAFYRAHHEEIDRLICENEGRDG